MQADKTAILFFTRSLEAEFKAKSFGLTKDRFRVIYHSLLKKTYQTLKTANLPIFEFNSELQVGDAFGERLVNAVSEIKENGYHRVIIVGNDAPDLSPNILDQAIASVSKDKSILGRDTHGGCYLMGFAIDDKVLEHLKHIHWHSKRVFEQLSSLLEANTSLPVLADINTRKDFTSALLLSNASRHFLIDLLQWVFSVCFKNALIEIPLYQVYLSASHQRGPPALA